MKPLSNSKSLIILIKCKNIFIKVGVCYMDFHAFYPGAFQISPISNEAK